MCEQCESEVMAPMKEMLASMPDDMRAQLRLSILADLDAAENMSESDRDELRSRQRAEAYARENGPGFVNRTPFGATVSVRTYPQYERWGQWAGIVIGSAVAMFVLVPLILSAPVLVPLVLGLTLSTVLAFGCGTAVHYGFHSYYKSVAKRLSGGRKLRPR